MKNYCRHKDAGEFHCCGSQQYSLGQQGIAQTYCDVHHWQGECARLTSKAVDQIVTINLLTNQVAALRKELDAGKKPAALATYTSMPHKSWHKGAPPHSGWWLTGLEETKTYNAWRWWNGVDWSYAVKQGCTSKYAGELAKTITARPKGSIVWSHYYPLNARVPRVDPGSVA